MRPGLLGLRRRHLFEEGAVGRGRRADRCPALEGGSIVDTYSQEGVRRFPLVLAAKYQPEPAIHTAATSSTAAHQRSRVTGRVGGCRQKEQQNEELLHISNQILDLTKAVDAMDIARSTSDPGRA
jgi:hypothetical protein